MTAITLKIAELRRKNGLTQQELGERLGVSYQTVSKWETGVTMPDITMLPALGECFRVSVDELLGLVPLADEYRSSNSGQKNYWLNRVEYLKRTREDLWNADYMKFLIDRVWKITEPVDILDCGCGFGALGLLMLPLLPEGSTYTGVDFAETMLDEGRQIFEKEGLKAKFCQADLFEMKRSGTYNLVISQALLRHVDRGELLLQKMIEFAGDGGLVVSIECNREFEAAGLYVEGMDYAALCRHEGLEKLWKTEYQMQKRDYSIAMKIPHYMREAGLKNIDVRMNDRVSYLAPGQPKYERRLENIAKADHWDEEKSTEQTEADIAYFMNHGMNRKEAEDYCRQQNGIVKYLKEHNGDAALTKFGGLMISYGWK